jgi:hypothetical protein
MQKEWPHLTVRSRYHQNAEELLNLVQRVEQGEPLPLRSPVVIEYGEIDPDVRAHLQSVGATEGVSGHEFLRRAVEREMNDGGRGRWRPRRGGRSRRARRGGGKCCCGQVRDLRRWTPRCLLHLTGVGLLPLSVVL